MALRRDGALTLKGRPVAMTEAARKIPVSYIVFKQSKTSFLTKLWT